MRILPHDDGYALKIGGDHTPLTRGQILLLLHDITAALLVMESRERFQPGSYILGDER